MALYETDLIKVVDELRLKGYTDNFIIKDNLMFSTGLNRGFPEREVRIEGAFQFDISEEVFDTQNVFAVAIPKYERKGLLIDLLGMYLYMDDQSITGMLRKVPMATYIFDELDPSRKYGLKKINPPDFDADSNRYVLRVGFPDFPECPAGAAFSMLGFDTREQEYVWLATRIIKDPRLKRVAYAVSNGAV